MIIWSRQHPRHKQSKTAIWQQLVIYHAGLQLINTDLVVFQLIQLHLFMHPLASATHHQLLAGTPSQLVSNYLSSFCKKLKSYSSVQYTNNPISHNFNMLLYTLIYDNNSFQQPLNQSGQKATNPPRPNNTGVGISLFTFTMHSLTRLRKCMPLSVVSQDVKWFGRWLRAIELERNVPKPQNGITICKLIQYRIWNQMKGPVSNPL
ncbi:hypothetical protein SS50377_28562 [Spironucleus salmonicida]|uniref:Uncharacterized protein n=1 Tax=Spironucleus salmonicida TaxID=348837 RepID=V6LBI6_9EUKA|nr:hypothetical protein SS50377_28562 [Spironucleus salmonicida]|eukprot:EST41613.1 Hypothetical protein SS50377_18962 [Spironucleus salmonicida]